MTRPICLEDGYEYRVKQIFKQLREDHAESFSADTDFQEWLETTDGAEQIANRFLEDVVTYMGIPEDET